MYIDGSGEGGYIEEYRNFTAVAMKNVIFWETET
jgi:hypothetical protein